MVAWKLHQGNTCDHVCGDIPPRSRGGGKPHLVRGSLPATISVLPPRSTVAVTIEAVRPAGTRWRRSRRRLAAMQCVLGFPKNPRIARHSWPKLALTRISFGCVANLIALRFVYDERIYTRYSLLN